MTPRRTTITVQLDITYDPGYVDISDVSTDLRERLPRVGEPRPGRSPFGECSWWVNGTRTFDTTSEPIGYDTLATAFDHIGEAIDRFDAGDLTADELHEAIREQVGEYETDRGLRDGQGGVAR